jgi:hypothetical protein
MSVFGDPPPAYEPAVDAGPWLHDNEEYGEVPPEYATQAPDSPPPQSPAESLQWGSEYSSDDSDFYLPDPVIPAAPVPPLPPIIPAMPPAHNPMHPMPAFLPIPVLHHIPAVGHGFSISISSESNAPAPATITYPPAKANKSFNINPVATGTWAIITLVAGVSIFNGVRNWWRRKREEIRQRKQFKLWQEAGILAPEMPFVFVKPDELAHQENQMMLQNTIDALQENLREHNERSAKRKAEEAKRKAQGRRLHPRQWKEIDFALRG